MKHAFFFLAATFTLFIAFTWVHIGGFIPISVALVYLALLALEEACVPDPYEVRVPKPRELTIAEMTVAWGDELRYKMQLILDSLDHESDELYAELAREDLRFNPFAQDEDIQFPIRDRADSVRQFNRALKERHKDIRNYDPLDGWDDTE